MYKQPYEDEMLEEQVAIRLREMLSRPCPRLAYITWLCSLCWYCGASLNPFHGSGGQIEHRTPRSKGGTDDPSNICVACVSCNMLKSHRTVEEFRHLLEERTKQRPWTFAGESEGYIERDRELADAAGRVPQAELFRTPH
jgi:5-methylcytosine-specific restriction endonuclease McrA